MTLDNITGNNILNFVQLFRHTSIVMMLSRYNANEVSFYIQYIHVGFYECTKACVNAITPSEYYVKIPVYRSKHRAHIRRHFWNNVEAFSKWETLQYISRINMNIYIYMQHIEIQRWFYKLIVDKLDEAIASLMVLSCGRNKGKKRAPFTRIHKRLQWTLTTV